MATSIKFYILGCDTMLSPENLVTVQSNISKYLPCYMSEHPRRQNFPVIFIINFQTQLWIKIYH